MEERVEWSGCLTVWTDELLFPEEVVCLCCLRALGEDAQDGLCPACVMALDALSLLQPVAPLEIEGISRVLCAYPYDAQAKRIIWMLKYHAVRSAAVPLIRAMAALPAGRADMIVPIPTDPERLKKRGFNQADVLARHMGDALGIPVVHALLRTQSRAAQSTLSAAERRSNMIGCMAACLPVCGKRILLVDDVVTTGSTAREAARALREGGAADVVLAAAARAGFSTGDDAEPFPLLYVYKKRGVSGRIHGNL